MQIGCIGAGNMAGALAAAIETAHQEHTFLAYDVDADRLAQFCGSRRRCATAASNREVVEKSSVTFLAVKPQVLDDVLPELTSNTRLIVSIAAGITLARLEDAMPHARVIRVMPNTPCLVGEMAAGFSAGTRVSPEDLNLVSELLQSAGVALELPESLLDAVTGLSGSGPAFVARLIEAFTAAGVGLGLPEDVASRLALATFRGTARLLEEKGLTPEELVTMVSSPNGTTVAGRAVFEASDYAEVISKTVNAAAARSRELGS
jgi:pyrroline-5-carboxylate reductase